MSAIDYLCAAVSPAQQRTEILDRRLTAARERQVLAAANRHFLTPALYAGLARRDLLASWSEDGRAVAAAFHEMNRSRNVLVADQLAECARALNAVGIVPLCLKGSGRLLSGDADDAARRIVSDLDLQVPHHRIAEAEAALDGIGYTRLRSFPFRDDSHAVADFTRDGDVAAVDLHYRLVGFPGMGDDAAHLTGVFPEERVRAEATRIPFRGADVLLPSPRDRAVHLILHDQIQDRDHFAGRLKLHRLLDLAELLTAHPEVDGDRIVADLSVHGLGAPAASHLHAVSALFGLPCSPGVRRSVGARLQHVRRRWLLTASRPPRANAIAGALAYEFARCRVPGEASALRLAAWRLNRLVRVLRTRKHDTWARLRREAAWL